MLPGNEVETLTKTTEVSPRKRGAPQQPQGSPSKKSAIAQPKTSSRAHVHGINPMQSDPVSKQQISLDAQLLAETQRTSRIKEEVLTNYERRLKQTEAELLTEKSRNLNLEQALEREKEVSKRETKILAERQQSLHQIFEHQLQLMNQYFLQALEVAKTSNRTMHPTQSNLPIQTTTATLTTTPVTISQQTLPNIQLANVIATQNQRLTDIETRLQTVLSRLPAQPPVSTSAPPPQVAPLLMSAATPVITTSTSTTVVNTSPQVAPVVLASPSASLTTVVVPPPITIPTLIPPVSGVLPSQPQLRRPPAASINPPVPSTTRPFVLPPVQSGSQPQPQQPHPTATKIPEPSSLRNDLRKLGLG